MHRRTALSLSLLVVLACCAPGPPPPALDGAIALVSPFYGETPPDGSPEGLQRLYLPDLAAAMTKVIEQHQPDPLGFDIRYGDETFKADKLAFVAKPAKGGAVVAARVVRLQG